MNTFVWSVISNYRQRLSCHYSIERVRLQCDILFTEVNSRNYLVASDKHVYLQCDTVETPLTDTSQ